MLNFVKQKFLYIWKSSRDRPETEKIAELFPNFKISNNVSDITTPYVFFIKDPFDFQPEQANFHRMILQAEEQRFDKKRPVTYIQSRKNLFLIFKLRYCRWCLGKPKWSLAPKLFSNRTSKIWIDNEKRVLQVNK